MMEPVRNQNRQTLFMFVVLIPIFLLFSWFLSHWFDGHKMDFGLYWQAGHMILNGQNVYDTTQWVDVRNQYESALHSEPTFQYPLPLAIFFTPLALFPLQSAYTAWIFLGQVAILTSIVILLQFYPERTGYFELLTVAGIFFFRPLFSVFNSGQILPFLILLISLSVKLLYKGHWFAGGVCLSILSLKPSVGFPILVLVGLWLLVGKRWKAIAGMFAGGFGLLAIGMLVNHRWLFDYINIGGNSFTKYYGMHPTLWGAVGQIVGKNSLGLAITILSVVTVIAIQVFFFSKHKTSTDPLSAFSSLLPAAILVAPYSWNYEQVLLLIPIVALSIHIASTYGMGKAALFMLGVVSLPMLLLAVAYTVHHDVWSVLTTLVVWLFSLYFFSWKTAELTGVVSTGSPA